MIHDALIAPFTEFEFMRRALAAVLALSLVLVSVIVSWAVQIVPVAPTYVWVASTSYWLVTVPVAWALPSPKSQS